MCIRTWKQQYFLFFEKGILKRSLGIIIAQLCQWKSTKTSPTAWELLWEVYAELEQQDLVNEELRLHWIILVFWYWHLFPAIRPIIFIRDKLNIAHDEVAESAFSKTGKNRERQNNCYKQQMDERGVYNWIETYSVENNGKLRKVQIEGVQKWRVRIFKVK